MKLFGDPLERALWLIDYVIKTDGAEHMKLSSRHLNMAQYLCLDVFIFLIIVIILVIYSFVIAASKLKRIFYSRSKKLKMS